MTPREAKALKQNKLQQQKRMTVHKKISNNFIQSEIFDLNKNALKTVFYLSSILKDFNFNNDLNTVIIDLRKMFKDTGLTAKTVRDNLKAMQKTSITFTTKNNDNEIDIEEFISLVPRIEFHYGQNMVEIDLYSKIAKLIIDVQSNYTMINIKNLMQLKNQHSLRMLPFLNRLAEYSDHVAKRKKMDLYDLNALFGTSYKRFVDIERYILKPVKEELDNNSKLTFIYQMNTEKIGAGRPPVTSITIDIITRNSYQAKLI